jgi:hypothetical protein
MRERRLLQEELARMPETQVEMARREELKRLTKYYLKLVEEESTVKKMYKEEKKEEKRKIILKLSKDIATRRIEVSNQMFSNRIGDFKEEKDKEKDKVLFNCPKGDCRGFVTTKEHKCGVCDIEVCKKCSVFIEDEVQHQCKKEDIETAKMLQRETKPCPECHILIYKIEGCDQMWCVHCKTPFSWRTGQKVFERIHNPHYYEWQRQMNGGVAPRVQGDVVGRNCQDEHRIAFYILATQRIFFNQDERYRLFFNNLHQTIGHLLDIAVPRVVRPDNMDIRILYLQKEISQEKLSQLVQRRDKLFEKKTEIRQIIELFDQVCEEQIFRKIREEGMYNREQAEKFTKKVYNIIKFINTQLELISKKYNMKRKKITYEQGYFKFI